MSAAIETKEDVLEYLEKNGVTFVNLWFADILGQLKSFNVYKTEVEGALDEGMGFDGSSIEGFVRIEESDLVAKPIPHTLRLLPYRPQNADRVATTQLLRYLHAQTCLRTKWQWQARPPESVQGKTQRLL